MIAKTRLSSDSSESEWRTAVPMGTVPMTANGKGPALGAV